MNVKLNSIHKLIGGTEDGNLNNTQKGNSLTAAEKMRLKKEQRAAEEFERMKQAAANKQLDGSQTKQKLYNQIYGGGLAKQNQQPVKKESTDSFEITRDEESLSGTVTQMFEDSLNNQTVQVGLPKKFSDNPVR